MTAYAAIWLLAALSVKHFVADFLYQPPYQWKNKGTFGHPGGILHAGQHAVATYFVLAFCPISMLAAIAVCAAEFVIHYITDWAKMDINTRYGWGANTHNEFWILLGIDQLIHSLTYVGIALTVARIA